MTVRWVISHFHQLPRSSRVWKHLIGDKAEWGANEHLTADVRDLLLQNTYFSMIAAQSNLKRSDWEKIVRDIPKSPLRPGDEPEEVKMASKEELMMLFGGRKPRGRRN